MAVFRGRLGEEEDRRTGGERGWRGGKEEEEGRSEEEGRKRGGAKEVGG